MGLSAVKAGSVLVGSNLYNCTSVVNLGSQMHFVNALPSMALLYRISLNFRGS